VNPFILFDVDGVLLDYDGEPMPGMQRVLNILRLLGYDIKVWSAGGAEHAQDAASQFGLDAECYTKPTYPIQVLDAIALLGGAPALQLDDDPTEHVDNWPFLLVEAA
jgi:hypothetical protein